MVEKVLKYKWHQARLWIFLLLYWLISMIGAGIIARLKEYPVFSHEIGPMLISMLILVSVCMVTERGRWKRWQKIGFVPFVYILHVVFFLPALAILSSWVPSHFVGRAACFIASLPIVVFAMRQSRLFVFRPEKDSKALQEDNSKGQNRPQTAERKIIAISKKIRITMVLSAIWFMLVLIFAIETTEKGRYFHFHDFFLVLIIGALLPLLIVWGIIWIRSASKSQDT